MVNLNDNHTYKLILESLLKALAKHPDFAEIADLVERQMPANAASRVKEILAEQESIASQQFDPDTGLWLTPTEEIQRQQVNRPNEDDGPYILIPSLSNSGKQAESASNDDPFFIPKSGDSDDDNFDVITYD